MNARERLVKELNLCMKQQTWPILPLTTFTYKTMEYSLGSYTQGSERVKKNKGVCAQKEKIIMCVSDSLPSYGL